MGNQLRKLNRRQLLELLVSQGRELQEQQKAAEAARARVEELEQKLRQLTVGALDAAAIMEQAREQADAYALARKAEADKQAEQILARAREGLSEPGEETIAQAEAGQEAAPAKEEDKREGPAQAGV